MFNIHLSIERWKWNADFGIYVSNKGRFKNSDKKLIPIQIKEGGYCSVYCGGSVHRQMLAHRVVMLTWRPTANAENLTVDHLDHNKRNNSLENLEWVTEEENLRRAKADLIVSVEGDPEMVKKVDVSVVTNQSPPTKYLYYIRLRGGAILSVEQFAEAFFAVYGNSTKGVGIVCNTVQDFERYVYNITKGPKQKIFGFEFKRIAK